MLGYGLLVPFICSLVFVLLGGVKIHSSGMCWIKELGGYPNIMSVISYIIYVLYMLKLKNEIKNVLKIVEHPETIKGAYNKKFKRGLIFFTLYTAYQNAQKMVAYAY